MTARVAQETTMTVGRDDEVAYVYTSSLPELRRLRKMAAAHDFVTEVRGGDDWAEFTVRAENFKPLIAIRKPRRVSEAQRAASRANGEAMAARRAGVSA